MSLPLFYYYFFISSNILIYIIGSLMFSFGGTSTEILLKKIFSKEDVSNLSASIFFTLISFFTILAYFIIYSNILIYFVGISVFSLGFGIGSRVFLRRIFPKDDVSDIFISTSFVSFSLLTIYALFFLYSNILIYLLTVFSGLFGFLSILHIIFRRKYSKMTANNIAYSTVLTLLSIFLLLTYFIKPNYILLSIGGILFVIMFGHDVISLMKIKYPRERARAIGTGVSFFIFSITLIYVYMRYFGNVLLLIVATFLNFYWLTDTFDWIFRKKLEDESKINNLSINFSLFILSFPMFYIYVFVYSHILIYVFASLMFSINFIGLDDILILRMPQEKASYVAGFLFYLFLSLFTFMGYFLVFKHVIIIFFGLIFIAFFMRNLYNLVRKRDVSEVEGG